MRRGAIALAGLAAAALTAGALPAFSSAPNGTVVGTVNVAPPPAPCLTISGTTINFGTRQLPAGPSGWVPSLDRIGMSSCATETQDVYVAASDATTASGGTWDLQTSSTNTQCRANAYGARHRNTFQGLYHYLSNPNSDGSYSTKLAPAMVAGTGAQVTPELQLPCRGSAGAGETVTMTFSFLAVLV